MYYRITDRKGDDYYNDTEKYSTMEAARAELARATAWAVEMAQVEPSWAHAELVIVREHTPEDLDALAVKLERLEYLEGRGWFEDERPIEEKRAEIATLRGWTARQNAENNYGSPIN